MPGRAASGLRYVSWRGCSGRGASKAATLVGPAIARRMRSAFVYDQIPMACGGTVLPSGKPSLMAAEK